MESDLEHFSFSEVAYELLGYQGITTIVFFKDRHGESPRESESSVGA